VIGSLIGCLFDGLVARLRESYARGPVYRGTPVEYTPEFRCHVCGRDTMAAHQLDSTSSCMYCFRPR
jgi:hypothetical protein